MKICFVGHAFHRKTGSSRFFVDLLKRLGDVSEFYSDPDGHPGHDDAVIRSLVGSRFDRYIFWQTEYIAEQLLPLELASSILIPMYDSIADKSEIDWLRFVKCKFISFSRKHHEALQRLGCSSAYFQYFPDPGEEVARPIDAGSLSAFFWERRPLSRINAASVAKRCAELGIGRLHIHAAPDFPDRQPARNAADVEGVQVSISHWVAERADYLAMAHAPLFFFAPREREGIGMATLEAMARGQIVVAPDLPTNNEYIAHEVSGLLYRADQQRDGECSPFSAARLAEMSSAARRKVVEGRSTWLKDIDRVLSVVAGDARRWGTTDYSAHFAREIRQAAHERAIRGW